MILSKKAEKELVRWVERANDGDESKQNGVISDRLKVGLGQSEAFHQEQGLQEFCSALFRRNGWGQSRDGIGNARRLQRFIQHCLIPI
jgi:hypothetical protein